MNMQEWSLTVYQIKNFYHLGKAGYRDTISNRGIKMSSVTINFVLNLSISFSNSPPSLSDIRRNLFNSLLLIIFLIKD